MLMTETGIVPEKVNEVLRITEELLIICMEYHILLFDIFDLDGGTCRNDHICNGHTYCTCKRLSLWTDFFEVIVISGQQTQWTSHSKEGKYFKLCVFQWLNLGQEYYIHYLLIYILSQMSYILLSQPSNEYWSVTDMLKQNKNFVFVENSNNINWPHQKIANTESGDKSFSEEN